MRIAVHRYNVSVNALGLASLLSIASSFSAPGATLEARVEELLKTMTLEEKIGQMTQVDSSALADKSHIQKYFLGSVLSGGNSDPHDNQPDSWRTLANECQSWSLKTRLKIPLLYGIDAVHGHNNVLGAVIFPHNVGLGAAHDTKLLEQVGRATAEELAATGINWTFAPCVAVSQDCRWGRSYESYSDSPKLVAQQGAALIRGLQGNHSIQSGSVLACAKHFVGDGGTLNGVDRGNTIVDEPTLRKLHLLPYEAAVKNDVGSIMASYSSWNGLKMHGNNHLLTAVLKGELRFQGFVVSDWAAIDELPFDSYKKAVECSINAGVDMAMIPYGPGKPNSYIDFITDVSELVHEGRIPAERIDDAVRRILRTKMRFGVFESTLPSASGLSQVGSAEHRKIARKCVRQSLVILKNKDATLPLPKNPNRLVVVGASANDLGAQCGGWTVTWQGSNGEVTSGGTTLLQAIRRTLGPNAPIAFSPEVTGLTSNDIALVVVSERPYAEMHGDRADLGLPENDRALIRSAAASGAKVVTIVFSGRPLILGDAFEASDAVVAAWLPGTEGSGMTDVLFGDCKPIGRLPRSWPLADGKSLPRGFGLTYK